MPLGLVVPKKPKLKRMNGWAKIRKEHLQQQPICQVCGTKVRLAVHHIVPVWVTPDLEGVATNLITLCENSKTIFCHFTFGHLGKWKRWNRDIINDAKDFTGKIKQAESQVDVMDMDAYGVGKK